jgi:hypothetical protein
VKRDGGWAAAVAAPSSKSNVVSSVPRIMPPADNARDAEESA